ncbi:MAG: hypothetical protein MK008_11240 [Bdellovibrionales bacterium]|nr:hypothetical protein [Bdellovibrionales bacterium]
MMITAMGHYYSDMVDLEKYNNKLIKPEAALVGTISEVSFGVNKVNLK